MSYIAKDASVSDDRKSVVVEGRTYVREMPKGMLLGSGLHVEIEDDNGDQAVLELNEADRNQINLNGVWCNQEQWRFLVSHFSEWVSEADDS